VQGKPLEDSKLVSAPIIARKAANSRISVSLFPELQNVGNFYAAALIY